MHEQSIVASLLSIAVENAKNDNVKKIITIRLTVGELTGVEKDAVTFYFGFLSKGTIAEGARLDFTFTKARLRCRDCDVIFSRDEMNFDCPRCRKKAVEIVGGRELYIDSMEVV